MSILTKILATLVSIEFIYIFYLETIATISEKTSKVFKIDKKDLENKNLNTLFKNQGVYNLCIALLILISIYILPNIEWLTIFLIHIIIVAFYGGVTSNKSIILKQGGLAILSLLSIFLSFYI